MLDLHRCPFDKLKGAWEAAERDYGKALLGKVDRFYLLTQLMRREDAFKPWLYARCREVEGEPDGCLDLWAREHYKSTIITFAGSIQEIFLDSAITIGIFSFKAPIAKKFLTQIKLELENNSVLKQLFPDGLYADPKNESPLWSTIELLLGPSLDRLVLL